MRVLLLTQVLPYPPDAGPKVKTFSLLRYLATQHEVWLVSFVRSEAEASQARHLAPYCRAVYTLPLQRTRWGDVQHLAASLLGDEPFVVARDRSRAMQALVRQLAREQHFDLVHADQLNMAQFALAIAGPRRVLDQHNAVWTVVRRLCEHERPGPHKALLAWEWRKLRRYEGWVCPAFDAVLAVSQEDRAALQPALVRPVPIHVIPIAIDTQTVRVIERRPDASALLIIGTLFWPPNVDGIDWFVRRVFPLIKRASPATRLFIVGARPASRLLRLAQRDSAIRVMGYVADPTSLIQQSALTVVPLRSGGGMRVRILNALAQGLPIVSTTIGCEGIAVRPGQHLLVADEPAAFAEAVLRLLREPELGRRLAAAGRELVEQSYDWRTVCPAIDAVYQTQT